MSVGCRIMGDIMVYIVGYITTSVSLKGDKVPLKQELIQFLTLTTFISPRLVLSPPFLAGKCI